MSLKYQPLMPRGVVSCPRTGGCTSSGDVKILCDCREHNDTTLLAAGGNLANISPLSERDEIQTLPPLCTTSLQQSHVHTMVEARSVNV